MIINETCRNISTFTISLSSNSLLITLAYFNINSTVSMIILFIVRKMSATSLWYCEIIISRSCNFYFEILNFSFFRGDFLASVLRSLLRLANLNSIKIIDKIFKGHKENSIITSILIFNSIFFTLRYLVPSRIRISPSFFPFSFSPRVS